MELSVYQPGQVRSIFPYVPASCKLFVVGGPADGSEGQEFALEFPNIPVIGFEPNRKFYEEQLTLRKFPGKLYSKALWHTSGLELPFCTMDEQQRSSRILCKAGEGKAEAYKVETQTLQSCQEAIELEARSTLALWIDVERAELEVLQGARELLCKGRICLVYFETFEDTFPKIAKLLQWAGLREQGRFNVSAQEKRFDSLFIF